jgi:hypothetical protein
MAPYLTPQKIAAYDNFGAALSVDGETLLAGAPGTELERAHNGGAAYIYQRQGKDWVEQARLLPDPPQPSSGFGFAVALSGKTAAVGARYASNPRAGNASGAVYIYIQQGNRWKLQARLAAPDGAPFDLFGDALALQGDILAVGARAADDLQGQRNTGAVYVYHRKDDIWNLAARLAPGDLNAEAHFGLSLALDGQVLVVGAPGYDSPPSFGSGSVYVFRLSGGNWVQEARLGVETPQASAQFGSKIALQGDILAALAPQEYQKGEMPPSAPAYSGDFGAAYIFAHQSGTWTQQTRLAPLSQEQYSLSLRGLALSKGSDGLRLMLSGMGMGKVYRYLQKGQEWQSLSTANIDSRPLVSGDVVSMTGSQILMGHRFFDLNNGPYTTGDPVMSAGAVFYIDW